jgi:hypothetical protein
LCSEGIYSQQKNKSSDEGNANLDLIGIGSEEDLGTISTHPLQRASFCLHMALHLSAGDLKVDAKAISNNCIIPTPKEGSTDVDMDCFEMALVSLAYTKLQLGDHDEALHIARKALSLGPDGTVDPSTSNSPHLRGLAEIYHHQAKLFLLK